VAAPLEPLPPEERTVGQLVAEAVRLYGRRFWPSLALGVLPAIAGVSLAATHRPLRFVLALTIWPLVVSISFVAACALAAGSRPTRGAAARAILLGVVLLVPAGFLASALILPGVAWLALVGLAVPAAVLERRGLRDSLARGVELGRADYVHAVGSLATLTIVGVVTSSALFFLIRGNKEALAVAAFLAVLVISPVLFLGSALLYFDQAARVVGSAPRSRRRRDADVSHALEPDRAGSADAEVEPRPAAGGQP
jgi:hypothetical protein